MPTISNNSAPPSALHAAAVLTGPNLARAQLSPPIAAGGNLSGDELQGPTDSEITIGNVTPSMGGTSTGFDMGATPTSAPSGSNIVIPFGQDGPLRSEPLHGGIAVILTSNNNSISGTCTPRAVTSNNSPSGIFGSSPLPINATSVYTASPPHMRSPSSNYGAHSSAHLSTSIITAAHPPHLSSVLHSGMSPAEQVKALRQSNMVAKAELQRKDVRIKALTKAVAETVTITESHEEQIMNKLLRQVDRIKREKERLLVHKIVEENRKTKEEERLKKITAERARLSERLKAEEYLIRSRLNKQLEAVQKQRRALEGKVNAETATLQELVDAFRNYQTLEEQAAKNLMIVGWNNETSLHLGSSASSIAIGGNNNTFASTASNIAPSPSHQLVNHVDPNSPPILDANAASGAAVLPVILSTVSHPHSTSPTQPWAPEKQLSGLSNSGATPHSGIAPLSSSSHHRGFHVTHTRQLSQLENESNASTSTLPGAASREPSIIAGARAPTTSSSFKAPSVLVGVSPYALGGIGGGAAPNTPQTTTSSKSGTSGQSAADPANALSDAFMIKQLQKEIRRARGLQADMRNRSAEFQQKRELLEERLFNWMNRRRRQDSGVVGGPQLQNNKGTLGTNLQSEGSFGAFALRNQNQWGDGNYSGATTINTSVAATPLRGSGIFNDSATIASSAAAYAAASNGRERANTANSSNYQFVPYNPNAAMSNNNLPAGLQGNSASPTPTHGHRSSPGGMARNSRHRNNSGFLPHAAGGNTGSPAAPSSFFGAANPNLAQGGDTTATDCSDAESNSLYAYKPASSMGGVAPTPVHGRVQPASNPNSASQRTPWRGGGGGGVTQNQTPFSVSTSPQSAIGQATGSQQAAAPTASEAASLLYASTQQRYQSLANHQLTSNASTSHASTSGVHAPGGSAPVALLGTSPSSQYRLASPSVTSSAQQGQASSATRQAPPNVATINVVANRHSYAASETSGRHTPYDASLMGVDTASQTPLASARSQPNVK